MNDPAHPLASSSSSTRPPRRWTTRLSAGQAAGSRAGPRRGVLARHGTRSAHPLRRGPGLPRQQPARRAATAVTSGASVVSDSWGDAAGDLLVDAATKTAFDNTFMLAASTGVSVLFSSGDDGDNFADFGLTVPDYPPSQPVRHRGRRHDARGRRRATPVRPSTAGPRPSRRCAGRYRDQLRHRHHADRAAGLARPAAAAGPATPTPSRSTRPGVVPRALALRNEALFGPVPLRVEPDISMDADAQSGMLIGLTQTFPNGRPLRPVQGRRHQPGVAAAGRRHRRRRPGRGRVARVPQPDPLQGRSRTPAAFNDIVPPANPNSAAVIRVDFANTVNSRRICREPPGHQLPGPETFCDGTGNCATRNVTLTAGRSFDGLTGVGSVGSTFIRTMSRF